MLCRCPLLGAAALRDIGFHFSRYGAEYKNIDSKILLRDTVTLIRDKGYEIGNADITICAERPKLNPHIPAMQECLSRIMCVEVEDVSIKADYDREVRLYRREEGISAYADRSARKTNKLFPRCAALFFSF